MAIFANWFHFFQKWDSFVYLGLRPVKIISFILSQVNRKLERKREIPEKNHLTARKQNLAWP